MAVKHDRYNIRIVHDDTTAVASHAILAVIKRIGAIESRAAASRKIGPDTLKGRRAVEELQFLPFAGLSRNLDCHVPAALADLPEPDQQRDYQQRSEGCHAWSKFRYLLSARHFTQINKHKDKEGIILKNRRAAMLES